MSVACPACGSENPDTSRFCGQCATPLAITCPSCGATAAPGQKFCGQCATPLTVTTLSDPHIPTQPEPPAAENRRVSVLFVDLVGFTTLSEGRDAEDVRELLSGYFDIARTIISRYGGVVEKFIGDAVMAVWGLPAAHEDDAERSVRAALEIVDAVSAYGNEHGVPTLQGRAGVVSGSVAAWTAPGEGLVAGDRVNTASRVQSVAEPGGVYVDDATRRSSSVAISYEDVGEHTVKGKAEPLHLWRAERVIAGVGGSVRVDGLEARFIGRDTDFRLVKELFHASFDRGSARLVSVVGAAGVGKSRLRWEFDKYVDGLADVVLWHNGRCLSYGDGVAYSALAEMVRQRLGIAEEDSNDVVGGKLTEGLEKWIPDAEEREFLYARVGLLLGLGSGELGREELFAGWRLFFERLADEEPVVLAFEDLHWADVGLLDFVEHLLDWSSDRPIFILTFARPEITERRPTWASGRRNATAVYLEPLSRADMAALLDDLVAHMPEPTKMRIVERAEGIPLYAVEMVRSLIDRDVVVPREGVYTMVGQADNLDVPTTLTSLISARIDALPSEERSLMQELSVLGDNFPKAAIAAVSTVSEGLDERLASLVRKEFLAVRTDKLSPDRGQYGFAQTLLRTVAYDMLSKKERKSRHLAVAAHLRSAYDNDGEDVAELIAAHYRDALLSGASDPDADEIRTQALTAYVRAGQRAAALGAPVTARHIYGTAADLAGDTEERLRLLEHAADMALQSGEHEVALGLLASLRDDYAAAGRDTDNARLAWRHARSLARLNRMAAAVDVLSEVLPAMEARGPSADLAHTTAWLAAFLTFKGRAQEAADYSERALILAQSLALPDVLCHALINRGTILNYLGRFEEGLIHVDAAVSLARQHELTDQELSALVNGSDLYMVADNSPKAIEFAEAALAISRRRGEQYVEVIAATNLMYVRLLTGDWDQVEQLFAELVETNRDPKLLQLRIAILNGWRGDLVAARAALTVLDELEWSESFDDRLALEAVLAIVANASRRPAEALTHAQFVIDQLGTIMSVRHEAMRLAWPEAVDAAISLSDYTRAAEITSVITDLPPGLVPPYYKAMACRARARIAAGLGDTAVVGAEFAAAEDMFGELGYVYWQARTQLEHAQWLAGQGRAAEAAPYAEAAIETFTRLQATAWVNKARELLPTSVNVAEASVDAAAVS
ncbi:MAG: adenylate/guanylate cyclase domain-containing protein [Actinomycetes bacterium]